MKKILLLCFLSLAVLGCKKNKKPIDPPTKAVLSLPNKDEACTSGTIISPTQSSILFKWNASLNTDSYELTIKNLETGTSTTQTTSALELAVTLSRNTPYSWFVTSKSTKIATTAPSDIWKFYNAGEAQTAFAPFPAEMVTPSLGQHISPTGGKITLQWNGNDVDNDIVNYDVYLGTTSSPALLKSNQTTSTLADVAVNAGTTYYWKVISRDSKGNTSDSGVSIFYTN
jgi:hypothetical protein